MELSNRCCKCISANLLYKTVTLVVFFAMLASCGGSDDSVTPSPSAVQQVSTFAGDGTFGNNDGTATNARFASPRAIAVATDGSFFIADWASNKIRKITPAGVVSTYAGTGEDGHQDGPLLNAKFNRPSGLAFHSNGDLYVADQFNNVIRKITTSGAVSTFAGDPIRIGGDENGNADEARFNKPTQIVFDSNDNLYITDQGKVRKITTTGIVSTFAGSDQGLAAYGITVDDQNNLYVSESDQNNQKISKISPSGEVTTLAGSTQGDTDGAATNAQFHDPGGLRINASGDIYIADIGNSKIRKLSASGEVTTIAGNPLGGYVDGTLEEARFENPNDLHIDAQGNLIVVDSENFVIRKITFK